MNITVEKVDDINYVIRGTIENNLVEEKVAKLKQQALQEPKSEENAQENIEQLAAGQVFQEFIEAGIKQAGIAVEEVLGQPGLKKYEKQGDTIHFEVDIATSPVIDIDIDFSDILPSYTKPQANPQAIETRMVEFATKQAPFTSIAQPRALQVGDIALIDFTGYINGTPFEGGKAEKFPLKIGSKSFIPGFEDQMIGMAYNEEKTITVTFPETYGSADLAGKETQFVIKLHEIQEQKTPDLDDAFAQQILSDKTATLETLREKLGDQIVAQELSELYMNELKPIIVHGLLGKFDFTLPNNIVEQEINAKVRERIQTLPAETQKEIIEDKNKFLTLRNSVEQEAKNTIKIALIVEAMAKKEGIDVDENEAISALTYQAMMAGQDAHELVNYYRQNNLMNSVIMGLTEDKLFGQMLGFHK